ncbi:hypothetical protein AKJ16_DCAP24599, partial [Drosera capensis]
ENFKWDPENPQAVFNEFRRKCMKHLKDTANKRAKRPADHLPNWLSPKVHSAFAEAHSDPSFEKRSIAGKNKQEKAGRRSRNPLSRFHIYSGTCKKKMRPVQEHFKEQLTTHNSRMLRDANFTVIVLIPKCDNPTRIIDFRPISCSNTIYKCIAKFLTNRCANVLPLLISPSHWYNLIAGWLFQEDEASKQSTTYN